MKTAFLHGDLKETVYVTQPDDFTIKGSETKVYKLNKALCGLQQAPRAWNDKLNCILKEFGLIRCKKEPSVYVKKMNECLLLIAVNVDDLFVTGTNLKLINNFKKEMTSKFEMSDLGKLTCYLGNEVIQHGDGVTLNQQNCALRILEEAGMKDFNLVNTPMDFGAKLSWAKNEKEIDATSYRRNIGCLWYLLHTWPDFSYCVGVLSRYMQRPKESHGAALKQCLRYLRGTTTCGLTFTRSSPRPTNLISYSESRHNVDPDDDKSTTGHVFYPGESLITWCSEK